LFFPPQIFHRFFQFHFTTTMDVVGAPYNPRTVEEVFRDFKGRRAALIKALTTGPSSLLFLEKN